MPDRTTQFTLLLMSLSLTLKLHQRAHGHTQERRSLSSPCDVRFAKLMHNCLDELAPPERPSLLPFGDEPAFNPYSSLYSEQAAAREAAFYNTTPGSDDLSATGYPQVFRHEPVDGLPAGFPVFFPVRLPSAHIFSVGEFDAWRMSF